MKGIFLVLALCLACSWAEEQGVTVPMIPTADVCAGKTITYQLHIIDALARPSGQNCSYLYSITSGNCLVATWFKRARSNGYVCYNTDSFYCTQTDNTLQGSMIEWCDNAKKTESAAPLVNYKYKTELLMKTYSSDVSVYADFMCDGVPWTPPRACAFSYGLTTVFALLLALALLFL